MRKGIKRLAAVTAFLLPLAALTVIPGAAVNNTGAFELDGNAVTDHTTAGAPDDWDRVCHQVLGTDCSTTSNTTGAAAVEWLSQGAGTGTTFTGGGSKDPIDVSSWAWNQASGGLPGKDILLNGFAARYNLPATLPTGTCPSTTSTCSVVFFGMDRFDNSGDAQNGFWFFQNPISLGSSKSGGGTTFNGVHKNGDVLVVSDFSIGGTISTISVYEWNSACTAAGNPMASCADSNLQLLQSSTAANCLTSAANAPFCGIVNAANGTTSPWPFTDKSGNTSFQQGEFYEGGINLSAFPGLAGECFASTLAESRSSTSTSAVLKSFLLGNFAACGSSTKTTPLDSGGKNISNGSVSIGTGSVSVKDQAVVTVTGTTTFGGSVTFHLCGPADLTSQPSCIAGGTLIGLAPSSVSPPSPVTVTSDLASVTSVGRYCWRAEYSGDASVGVPGSSDSSSTECFTVTPVTPTLVTSASGGGNLPTTISDTATLTGTANEPGTPVINPTTPGAAAKGTITFTVFFGPTCTSTAFGPTTVSVNGDGTYGPVSFTPTAVGTYTFVASYSGDLPNTNGVPATACPDTTGTETVLVTDTSSVSSAQTWVPNDTATASSGSGATALNGTLTIALHESSDCSGAAVLGQTYSKTLTNASTVADRTLATSNSTYSVSVTKTVSWLVTFTPTAGSNVSGSFHCESTALTITN